MVHTPFTVSGKHHNNEGNYWLITNYRDEYWPKSRLHLRPDGKWQQEISTGDGVTSTILLVKASDLQERLFEEWKQNAERNKWKALTLILPPAAMEKNFIVVDTLVVNVAAK